jgi:RNA polymerase sigma-70 factor (ECF subfamily)
MKSSSGEVADKNSDVALVAATKHGDSQAFEELVLRHKRRVFAVAKRITNNWEDAEDVAQESFHKAFLHLDSFQEKSRFSTWLTRIAMNEALMLLRRKRGVFEALPENPENGAKSSLEPFVDRSPDPEESCWRREHKQLLTKAIDGLGPKVRRTILLRDIEERSVEETAQIMGISTSAVKARVFQGRRRLRQTVNPALLIGFCEPDPGAAQRF